MSHGKVQIVASDADFKPALTAAGDKLVVIDFTAVWCGPCQRIAPKFAAFSDKYTDVVFLKVDVDQLAATAQACGIQCMPTFQFYRNGSKIGEFSGADEAKLEAEIQSRK